MSRTAVDLYRWGAFVVTDSFARFVVLSIDMQGYGKAHDQDQISIQDELLGILAAAAAAAGLDRRAWHRQGQGDGELALIAAGEPDAGTRVVDDYVRELAATLFWRNCDRPADGRLRLRLAVDHGLVRPASNGFAGRPVVMVSRLVGCRPLRQAMASAPDANLAVILSRQVYTELVLGGHTKLRPADFRRVSVREKELTDQAWLRVPGVDVHRLQITPDPATQDGTAPTGRGAPVRALPGAGRDGQVVVNEFVGAVDARHGVIGIHNDR
jgi:hypothetical protein